MAKTTLPPELREPRIFWADYGHRIEAYDRPASREDAVKLAYAYTYTPVAGPKRVRWAVATIEKDRHPSAVDTKKAAKESVARIARRILRKRSATDYREES